MTMSLIETQTLQERIVEATMAHVGRQDFPGVCGDLVRLVLKDAGCEVTGRVRDIGEPIELKDAGPDDLLYNYDTQGNATAASIIISGRARITIEFPEREFSYDGLLYVSVWKIVRGQNRGCVQIRDISIDSFHYAGARRIKEPGPMGRIVLREELQARIVKAASYCESGWPKRIEYVV